MLLLSSVRRSLVTLPFFFTATATTEIYTLSLHDALPISGADPPRGAGAARDADFHDVRPLVLPPLPRFRRSEEHTSELQSRRDLVCRLLLEKKKNNVHGDKPETLYFPL